MGVCLKLVKWDTVHKRNANLPGVNLILTILSTHTKKEKVKKGKNQSWK